MSASQIDSHPCVVRVRAALEADGAQGRVVVLDEHARTAIAAAEQLGVKVGQIANSLVFATPAATTDTADSTNRPRRDTVLIMTSGAHRVDLVKVAAELGIPKLERADPDLVRERTGFTIGGVAPVAHLYPPRVIVVDASLEQYPEIWAAAGHARTVFSTTYAELLRITGGIAMQVN